MTLQVSVVVITLNEEKNIGVLLDSLLKQTYDTDRFEIIIVDGGSKDKTQEIVKSYEQKGNVQLIVDKGGSITSSRNLGVRSARFPYIAFTDADCIAPKDWLSGLVDGFRELDVENLGGVGGANIPPKDASYFLSAVGIAFDSFLGSLGSIQAKPFSSTKKVFSISCSNSMYSKKALESVGLFSMDLGNQCEDWELGYKLGKKGYQLFGLADHFVWHNMRSTPASFWKNMVFYGDGRMRATKKHPNGFRLIYALPFVFILGMASIVLSFAHWIFLLPLLYFPVIFLYSFWLCLLKGKLKLLNSVVLAFLILHFGYAFGEVKGLRWFLR